MLFRVTLSPSPAVSDVVNLRSAGEPVLTLHVTTREKGVRPPRLALTPCQRVGQW